MSRYDVIVVGGGLAGLTAGLVLARRGKRVVVCERHTAAGGCVNSFTRKGFRFDSGAGSFSSGGIVFPILRTLGLEEAVRSVRLGFSVVIGGQELELTSPESVIESLGGLFPASRGDLARYFRRLGPLMRLMALFTRQGAFAESWTGYLGLGAALALRPSVLAAMLREKGKTSDQLLEATIRDPGLRRILRALGYPVMSVSAVAGLWFSMAEDYWYPLGGLGVIADALAGAFKEAGGELRLGSGVGTILVAGERARGVRLQEGEVLEGPLVVSAADMTWTYGEETLERVEQTLGSAQEGQGPSVSNAALTALRRRLDAGVPSESFFSTYVGARMGPEEIARHTFCVSIFGDPADPRDEPLNVYLSSRADPSAAPEGHASLTLHQFAAYEDWARLAGSSGDGRGPAAPKRPEAYRQAKEETAARALARAEGVFPGLTGRIVVRDAATPVTYERYTGNRAGASVGWNWNPAHRPISGIKGPVAGLVTVGHWSYAPGGIPTALITGYLLGKKV